MLQLLQSGILQGKLSVSQKGDPSEAEADRVADAVASGTPMPSFAPACSSCGTDGSCPTCQRKEADGAFASPSVPAGVVPSSGQTLDEGVRTLAEGRMGRDFSNVRIHTGTDANAAAKSIRARAYTVGENIVFAQNQYQPNTQTGQRLIAHELAHVAQQRDRPQPTTLHRNGADDGVEPSGAPQPDTLDVAMRVSELDPNLASVVLEYDTLRGMVHISDPSLDAVDAAYAEMIRANYSGGAVLAWLRSIQATQTFFGRRHEWAVTPHERKWQQFARVYGFITRAIPSLEQAVDQEREGRARAEAAATRESLTRQLIERIRERWPAIRDASSIVAVEIEDLMRDELETREAVDEYVAGLAETNPQLGQFLELLLRNPNVLQRAHNDVIRALAVAVLGEWADVLPETRDQRVAAQLTGDSEASMEAEIAGIAIGTMITLIPGLDQVGDLRDLSAHVYTLLNIDGQHAEAWQDPLVWLDVALTGIGLVPELGSALKGVGNIIVTVIRRVGDAVGPIVRQASEAAVAAVRRYAPEAIPFAERLLSKVTAGWDEVAAVVRSSWAEISQLVTAGLESSLVRLTDFGRRLQAQWNAVRSASSEMINAALARLRRLFEPVLESVTASLRGGAEAVVAAIPPRVIELGTQALARSGEALQEARRHLRDIGDALSSPTRRMQRLDEAATALEGVQRRLQDALDAGDSALAEQLSEEAMRLSSDIERRISRSASADGVVAEPPRGAGDAPQRPSQRVGNEERGEQVEVESHPRPTPSQASEEVRAHWGQARPSTDPDYLIEVPVGDGHIWRRNREGRWCRFSEPYCPTDQTSQLLNEVLDETALRDAVARMWEARRQGDRAAEEAARRDAYEASARLPEREPRTPALDRALEPSTTPLLDEMLDDPTSTSPSPDIVDEVASPGSAGQATQPPGSAGQATQPPGSAGQATQPRAVFVGEVRLPSGARVRRYRTTSGNQARRVLREGIAISAVHGSQGELLSLTTRLLPEALGSGTAVTRRARELTEQMGLLADDTGHALARASGGTGDATTGLHFPQNARINRGVFARFEARLRRLVRDSSTIDTINYRWEGRYQPGQTRPFEYVVDVWVNNTRTTMVFPNPP